MRPITVLPICLCLACGGFSKNPGVSGGFSEKEEVDEIVVDAPQSVVASVETDADDHRESRPRAEPPRRPRVSPPPEPRMEDERMVKLEESKARESKPRGDAPGKDLVGDTTVATTEARRFEPREPPKSPGVKAGAADDNLQYGAFLDFLGKHQNSGIHRDLSDRLIVEVKDDKGLPIHGASIELRVGGQQVVQKRVTYADGRALLFPSDAAGHARKDLTVHMSHGRLNKTVRLEDDQTHRVVFRLLESRKQLDTVPLDIAFILDTTGSMGDEIARLKKTIDTIHFQIEHLTPKPDVRFGMVLYRDRGDEYVTQKIAFTRNLAGFINALDTVSAGGGNDYPEDVQSGLQVAMKRLKWRSDGVQIAFLVGDAPPHLDYEQPYTYQHAAAEAAQRGIKIATIGASGLSDIGELVWRQLAQYTMAPFVFLTYGETGDSAPGTPAMVSHHIGSNWVAENLDAIIIRMVKVELAHLSPRGAPVREDFFAAQSASEVPKDTILEDLFARSVKQLLDYSVERIEPRTPTVILPLTAKKGGPSTEKLERRLMLGLSRRSQFQLLAREERGALLDKLAEQLSAKYDATQATEVGKLVPAELAVLSSLSQGNPGQMEMLVKLVRLETGEVLSLSLLRIDEALLL